MMIDQYIQQLQSPDPAQRRSAIIALANAKDPAALKPLGAIYRTDPDPALRELALKAGRYIQQAAPAAQTTASAAAEPALLRAEPVLPPEPDQDRPVSARDQELSRGLLDASVSHLTAGDRARAAETLGKALALNPRLHKETFVANMVITLTNRPLREGVAVLSDPIARDDLLASLGGKRKLKAQTHGKGAETATWSNVAIDLALYGLIFVLVSIVISVLALHMLEEMFDLLPAPSDPASVTLFTPEEYFDFIAEASLITLLPTAIVQSLSSIFGLLINAIAIHLAATMIMKGDGTLVYLLRRAVPFLTVVLMAYAGLFVVLSLLGVSETTIKLYGLLAFVGTLVVIYFLSSIIGQVYNFGTGGGCVALLFGQILLTVVGFCGYCGLISVLGSLLGGAS